MEKKVREPENMEGLENLMELMSIYRSEWEVRDRNFNASLWRFGYLSLLISFVPLFFPGAKESDIPLLSLPSWVFTLAGLLTAFFGLLYCIVEGEKISILDRTYRELASSLPERYQEKRLTELAAESRGFRRIFYRLCTLRTNTVLYIGVFAAVCVFSLMNIIC